MAAPSSSSRVLKLVSVRSMTQRSPDSYQEAAEYSRLRREGLASWRGSFDRDSFGWVERPVLNPYTRIAIEMNPARGILRALGYELAGGDEVASPVTERCELTPDCVAA